MKLRNEHRDKMVGLIRIYPNRIIWGAITPDGRELTGADYNRRQINKMVKMGYYVETAEFK